GFANHVVTFPRSRSTSGVSRSPFTMSPLLIKISKDLKLLRCPRSLAPTLVTFTLITRTGRACASYPSCVAVYPRDSQSRRVLCRASHALHSQQSTPEGGVQRTARPNCQLPRASASVFFHSSRVSWSFAAAMFSSRCASEDV